MFAVTMETATQGVEASLAEVLSNSSQLFWFSKIKLPLIERRLLKRMRGFNQSIASCNLKLIGLRGAVKFDGAELIDPDLHMRDLLQSIKDDAIRYRAGYQARIHSRARGWSSKLSKAIADEMQRTIALCCETHELANRMQWEVAEHDADFAARHEGFVATTADEVMALLNRL